LLICWFIDFYLFFILLYVVYFITFIFIVLQTCFGTVISKFSCSSMKGLNQQTRNCINWTMNNKTKGENEGTVYFVEATEQKTRDLDWTIYAMLKFIRINVSLQTSQYFVRFYLLAVNNKGILSSLTWYKNLLTQT